MTWLVAATATQYLQVMLREFERDLEVHVPSVWRDMRTERADALLLAPEAGTLSLAARWRPVVRTLLSALRKQQQDLGHAQVICGEIAGPWPGDGC